MPQSEPSSLRRRPVRVCRLFWCHRCLRTVRIIGFPEFRAFCPRCFGPFLHELDFPRPRFPSDYMGLSLDPSHSPHFQDYLSAVLGLSDSWVIFPQGGLVAGGGLPEFLHGLRDPEAHFPVPPAPAEVLPRENATTPSVRPGDYFTGPGFLNDLIEGLTQDDRPGPPPAPVSAIDAIPVVTIVESHLAEDGSQCPVCKEEWSPGEEARELPCKHVYHSDCIVPWLQSHNSCPVCRHALPAGEAADDEGEQDNSSGEDGEEVPGGTVVRPRRFSWNPFNLLSPSRWFSSNRGHSAARRHVERDGVNGRFDGCNASSF